ncbi:hypothetical protein C9I92_13945 [Photobacterium ganghwense]|nr:MULTISPECIES: hypothetical protein [Photobacterium]PSU08593.1 hypothetical protein C9I92_13945 [Photobacterium ganghwense]
MATQTKAKLCALAVISACCMTSLAMAEESTMSNDMMTDKIGRAKSAAPPSVSNDATIIVDGKEVVKGTNGWTCMPETMPGDNAPICADAVWLEMMGALTSKADYKPTRIGISYMLQGDAGGGVSNSDPYHASPKEAADYVETGPHMMIIVPKEMLTGLTDDPSKGGPYVMWKDTPYAHIMIPVADK